MTALQEQQQRAAVQRGASRVSWEEMSSRRETTKFLGVAVLVMDTHCRDENESEKEKAGMKSR